MSQPETYLKTLPASPADVHSVDAILTALYAAISFSPNGQPNWDRVRSLMIPGARFIPPRREESGDYPVMDMESFVKWGNQLAETNGLFVTGFYEKQVACTTEAFGNIVHAFSTYESRCTVDDPQPFERGINSIQLAWDRGRWWVVTVFWDIEAEDKPIPAQYLSTR
jgi:hypothetical protein